MLHLFRVRQKARQLRRQARFFVFRQLESRKTRDSLDVLASEMAGHARDRSMAAQPLQLVPATVARSSAGEGQVA